MAISTASHNRELEERFFFESDSRPLYAVLRRGSRANAPAVIFCNCLSENYWEWRAESVAAQMLAQAGYTTLSFHPRAHGDSAGDPADMTIDGLVDDALAASDLVRSRSGAAQVAWVGIRFGAIVAAGAIARSSAAAAFALWEPVVEPTDYFAKLMRHVLYYELSQGMRPSVTVEEMRGRLEQEGRVPVLTFDLYRKFTASASDLDLPGLLENWRGPAFLSQFQAHSKLSRENFRLKEILESRGIRVTAAAESQASAQRDSWQHPESRIDHLRNWLDGLG
jgi:pimeloyl-ACP methyl ester carboxylesterase